MYLLPHTVVKKSLITTNHRARVPEPCDESISLRPTGMILNCDPGFSLRSTPGYQPGVPSGLKSNY